MTYIILTIILLSYLNLVRYLELKKNTSLFTWKEYFNQAGTQGYNFTIIIIIEIFYAFNNL